jgi:hypothetical protein
MLIAIPRNPHFAEGGQRERSGIFAMFSHFRLPDVPRPLGWDTTFTTFTTITTTTGFGDPCRQRWRLCPNDRHSGNDSKGGCEPNVGSGQLRASYGHSERGLGRGRCRFLSRTPFRPLVYSPHRPDMGQYRKAFSANEDACDWYFYSSERPRSSLVILFFEIDHVTISPASIGDTA